MKTFAALRHLIDHGLSPSEISTKHTKSTRSDRNCNASPSRSDYERDKCEEELYRLRYEIENLLDSTGAQNLQELKKQLFRTSQRSSDPNYERNSSWFDRCSPCCRRWRRPTMPARKRISDQQDYSRSMDSPQNDEFQQDRSKAWKDRAKSNSPSPSTSSFRVPWSRSGTKKNLRQTVDKLINSGKNSTSSIFQSKDRAEQDYDPLMLKILELKAMDCLCSDFSKQKNQQKLRRALAEAHLKYLGYPLIQRDANNEYLHIREKTPKDSPSLSWDQSSVDSALPSASSSISTGSTTSSVQSLTPISSGSPSPSPIVESPGKSRSRTSTRKSKRRSKSRRARSKTRTPSDKKLKPIGSKTKGIPSPKRKTKTINARTKSKQLLSPKANASRSKSKTNRSTKSSAKSRTKSSGTSQAKRTGKSTGKRTGKSKGKSTSKSTSKSRGKGKGKSKGKTPIKSQRTPKKRRKKRARSNNQAEDQDIEVLSSMVSASFSQRTYQNPKQILALLLARE